MRGHGGGVQRAIITQTESVIVNNVVYRLVFLLPFACQRRRHL